MVHGPRNSPETALVVDDEPSVLRSLARRLRRSGYTVHAAPNLGTARDLLGKCRFDVAVVDQNLPDGLGSDLLRELWRLQPACARILVTGGAELQSVIKAVNAGELHQFLLKPFLPTELHDALRLAGDRVQSQLAAARRARQAEDARGNLSRLLAGQDFRLDWQPIVGADGGTLLGVEGLIRSRDPELSGPSQILSLAEKLGMLRHVGRAVVGQATPALSQLPGESCLFLNLHPEELADQDALEDQLAPLAPAAHRVCLEITGRAHERWPRTLGQKVARLRELGFDFALDDLGAGQGALVLLAEVAPRFIKAHHSIVRDIDRQPGRRRLMEMVCAFAAASGAEVVAEGVEREAEANELRSLGVKYLQGYHIGHPGALASATAALQKMQEHAPAR